MHDRIISLVLAALICLMLPPQVQALEQQPTDEVVAVTGRININEANAQTLARELKGIGPAKAQAIVDYRMQQGDFISVDELLEVKGIGVVTLENIREQLTVD